MAGINNGGSMSLIRYRVFRTHLQYSLPTATKLAASGGYSQVETRNVGDFTNAAVGTGSIANPQSLLAGKIQYGYASLIYDPLSWLRFAGEFGRTRDTYINGSPAYRFANNNRVQLTAFFIF